MSRLTEAFWRLSHPEKYEGARPLRDRLWVEVSKLLPKGATPWEGRAAMVIVGAVLDGTDVNRLVRLTGYEHDFVAQVAVRMRTARLWSGDYIDCEAWGRDEPEGHIYFSRDLSVAEGKLFRDPKDDSFVRRIQHTATGPRRVLDPVTKKLILHKLQAAIFRQNELWDLTNSVAEILEWNLEDLNDWITTTSSQCDGADLTEEDVDYYFGHRSCDKPEIANCESDSIK